MSAWHDYQVLWRAALVQRHPRAAPLTKTLVALILTACAVIGLYRHEWLRAARIGLGVSAVVGLFLCVMAFIPGAALMNTPGNARLVPRMRQRLVEMTVACWVTAGVAGLLFPTWQAAPLIALWVIGMSMGRGGSNVGSVMVVFAAMWGTIVKMIPPALLAFLMTVPGFLCAILAVAIFGAYAIRVVLPSGGERHFAQRQRQAATIVRLESMGRKQPGMAGRKARMYDHVLRRDCRSGEPGRLMMHVLGPSAHWIGALPMCAFLLVLGVVAHLLLPLWGDQENQQSLPIVAWILAATLGVVVQVGLIEQWKIRIGAARSEQSLFRLSARSPAAQELNRCLAGALVRSVLYLWGILVGSIVALCLLTGASVGVLACLASLVTATVAPAIAYLLRDYAREEKDFGFGKLLLVLLVVVIATGPVFVLQAEFGAGAWVLFAVVSNAIGAVIGLGRWRRMLAAPVAFPAHRLA